jgi:hypothetical protein
MSVRVVLYESKDNSSIISTPRSLQEKDTIPQGGLIHICGKIGE